MHLKNATKHILAFDFGTKSIGVAHADMEAYALAACCDELVPIPATEGIPNWDDIKALLDEYKTTKVIVGLPFDSQGKDMEITRRARKFGNRLKGMFNADVEFVDETLSTKEAKIEAETRGHKGHYKSAPVDSIAARLILESWLHQHH
ncbi:MAG: Holliday junction resolvase RuvX [Agarilytica sp.]